MRRALRCCGCIRLLLDWEVIRGCSTLGCKALISLSSALRAGMQGFSEAVVIFACAEHSGVRRLHQERSAALEQLDALKPPPPCA